MEDVGCRWWSNAVRFATGIQWKSCWHPLVAAVSTAAYITDAPQRPHPRRAAVLLDPNSRSGTRCT
ncbi:hypothetical protein K438DRAFT_1840572 [Mycena galopus ATCC 62051]|nr:hypothetical protein K438DRAFT_1840572 [Mycena galopus ATCC 62051]